MSSATDPSPETPETGSDVNSSQTEREIGHDEFEPVGTLALVLVYFGIVVLLWVFMYFVEFLGRGPTVV